MESSIFALKYFELTLHTHTHTHTCIYSWVSQKFRNILVTWCPTQQVWMHLLRLWKWPTTLDGEMPSSPDNLRVQLVRFVSMVWGMASKPMIFGAPDFVWLLQTEQNFFNHLVTVLWSTLHLYFTKQLFFW